MMILQCARNDFRSRRRPSINQHDNRRAAGNVAGNCAFRPPAFDGFLVAPAFGDDLAFGQEGIGHGDSFIEDAAGVRAQIDDITQGLAAH